MKKYCAGCKRYWPCDKEFFRPAAGGFQSECRTCEEEKKEKPVSNIPVGKFEWIKPVPESVLKARSKAIDEAGGVSHVARTLGISRPVIDRMRNVGSAKSAEKTSQLDARLARAIVQMTDGKVSLKQIAPDQFGKLTVKELGYTPKPE